MSTPDNAKKIAVLNFLFTGFWGSSVIGDLLFSIGMILAVMTRNELVVGMETVAHTAMFFGLMALIAVPVFGFVMSDLIRRPINNDTDPSAFAKAAGYCFVPLLLCIFALLNYAYSWRRREMAYLLTAMIFSIMAMFFFKSHKENAVRLLESESDWISHL